MLMKRIMKRIEMIAQFLNFNKKVFRKIERFRGGCVCSIIEDFRIFRGIDEKITILKFLIRGIEYPARLASTGIHILLESLELAEQKGDAIIPPFQFSTEHTFQSDSTRRAGERRGGGREKS